MAEKKQINLDILLKIAAPGITVAGILIGVWQYSHNQKFLVKKEYNLIEKNDALEFKRNIWKKQQEAYEEIGNVVSAVVNSADETSSFNKNVKQFQGLYWGKVVLVQDNNVEIAMIKFNAEIHDFREGIRTKDHLKKRGYELVKTCKASLHESWETLDYYANK